MSRRRKSTDTTPFDTLRLEGSLFVPELLERAAGGEATFQKETDYAIPKGLKLHDEYGRAFRIATATWQSFAPQTARADLDAATVTRAFVVDFLRQCLGYTDLDPLGAPIQLGDRGFPVTAQAIGGRLPVIIAPHHLGLDDPDPRFAIIGSGSRKKSAHQLAQEFLNASSDSLWAIVTNGKTLRLLRDADTLTRPNFLEFDLEAILRDDQHRYADFSALWRILHSSRAVSPDSPAACIWEQWKSEGHAQGLRVRDGLRDGVTQALLILGRGFLTQPDNIALRQRLHDGTLTTDAYFQQLLRLIYRSLFLFCAEERDLLHPPRDQLSEINNPQSEIDHLKARQAYATGYSLRRFRSRALRQSAHDPHGDLWQSLRIVFHSLSGGQEKLALPALGGLFAETQCPDLDSAAITNRDLLSAMRELRWFFDKKTGKRSAIDYRNMGPEELGSVYESLLELVPTLDLPGRVFGFAGITDAASSSGNARKTTGSYYTPDSLVQELIKSALDPVIAQKLADHPANPIDALLSITVCDPSCGSGHFLLAAARRLAEKLAELRAPDGAVRPDDYRHALREVASRCLYGVDINPMAVELCRVALWLETVDPGKPLGFLNHHIRSGNSLLGTTPDLIAAGLPDETFTAIEGDDKKACAELKKLNRLERDGFIHLFAREEDGIREKLRQAATSIEAMDDSQPDALQKKEAAFLTNETAPEYRHAKLLADLWCAAFVIKKTYPTDPVDSQISYPESQIPASVEGQLLHTDDDLFGQPVPAAKPTVKPKPSLKTETFKLGTASGITTGNLRDFVQGKPLSNELEDEVNQLASQYRFFHWHLAFPQVFEQGGFDCILGNPPWVRQELLKPFKPLLVIFRSFVSTADSSVYFLELGATICRVGGRLAMLTPNKWFRANYADKLRTVIREVCRTDLAIDFGHSRNLFPDADTFPAAVVFERVSTPVSNSVTARFVRAHDSDREVRDLGGLIRDCSVPVPHGNLLHTGWQLEDESASLLFARLMKTGSPLESLLRRPILSGLKTGFNQAFYIETATRDALVRTDPSANGLIKRFLRGRDVKRWNVSWADQWHIVIPSGQNHAWPWSNAPTEREAERIFSATYPTVHAHLKQFEAKLRERQDKGQYWWELRSCDYYSDFHCPKIIVQCIAYYSQYSIDIAGHYVNNKAIVIPTDDLYLLAVLNSRIMWWIVNRTFQHMKDDGLSVDVHFLRNLPIPDAGNILKIAIRDRAKALITTTNISEAHQAEGELEIELNTLVEASFGLTDSERKIMTTSLPPRDPISPYADQQVRQTSPYLYTDLESWRGMPMELPKEYRVPLPQAYQYVVSVMIEIVMQAGGALSWATLRAATDLLGDREKLASLAKPLAGEVADEWLKLTGDRFDATLRFDQLSGLCYAGRLAVTEQDSELVVELLTLEKHVNFPHVRFDARIALAVAEELALAQPVNIPAEERKKVAALVSH